MRTINPDHVEAARELANLGPYMELLSMRVTELGIGHATVELTVEDKHLNPFGAIHGGVYSSVIDSACYWSAYCELDEDAGLTSIDMTVSNLGMISEGRMVVEGRSLKVGRSICLAEASVRDVRGRLLAHGTSKLMVLHGKQSINHAVEAVGYRKLPPKFLD